MKSKAQTDKIFQQARLSNTVDMEAAMTGNLTNNQVRLVEVELLVDTGAAILCLTPPLIEKLGLRKLNEWDVITGNGLVKRAIFSPMRISIFSRETDLNVMEVHTGTPLLLGYFPLEALDLYPNPKERKLEGNPKYDGKMVIDLL